MRLIDYLKENSRFTLHKGDTGLLEVKFGGLVVAQTIHHPTAEEIRWLKDGEKSGTGFIGKQAVIGTFQEGKHFQIDFLHRTTIRIYNKRGDE